jgi:hypothetical protein
MGYPTQQVIDRAGNAELVRLRIERTLDDVDMLVTSRRATRERDDQLQVLLTHYEELRWHALALAT